MRRDRPNVTLIVVCLALGTVMAGISGFVVALPDIGASTQATQTQLTWFIDAYSLTFALLLLPSGALGDRYGRRRLLVLGLAVYLGASLLAAFSDGAGALIALRAVTGVGAAMIMPATLATITATFPPEKRGRGVATWAAVAAVGGTIGTMGCGVVLEIWSYRSVFALNVGLAAVGLVGALLFVPESRQQTRRALDVVGAVLSVLGLAPIVYSIIEAPLHGWASVRTLSGIIGGSVILMGFVRWELHCSTPLLDPRVFRSRRFAAGTFAVTMQFYAFFGFVFVFLQFLQFVRGQSPFRSSITVLPFGLGIIGTTPLGAKLIPRIGPAVVTTLGLLLMSASMLCFWRVTPADGELLTGLGFLVLGAGLGLSMLTGTSAITDGLPTDEQGVASAVNDLSRELGGALGIAVTGSILNSVYRAHLHLPPGPVAERARESLAVALRLGPAVTDHARAAFVHATHTASLLIGATLLVSAAITYALMSRQRAETVRSSERPSGKQHDPSAVRAPSS